MCIELLWLVHIERFWCVPAALPSTPVAAASLVLLPYPTCNAARLQSARDAVV